jgi:hypothetical protein
MRQCKFTEELTKVDGKLKLTESLLESKVMLSPIPFFPLCIPLFYVKNSY